MILIKNNKLLVILTAASVLGSAPAEPAEELDILAYDTAELDLMTVIASRRERPLREVANSISVIDAERIAETLSRDIKDLARYTPWLDVNNDPSRFGLGGYTIRGIGANRIATEVDGAPLASGFSVGSYSSSGRNTINPAMIKRVEILRGPASALYGSDAIGGVVSYTSFQPGDFLQGPGANRHFATSGGYDTRDDSINLTMLGAADLGETAVLLTANRRQGHATDNTATLPAAEPNPRNFHETGAALRLVHGLEERELGLTLDFYNSHGRTEVDNLEGQGRFASTVALRGDDRQTRQRIAADGRFTPGNRLADDVSLVMHFQRTRTDQRTIEERAAAARSPSPTLRFPEFHFEERSAGIDISVSRDIEMQAFAHRFLYGLQYRLTRVAENRTNLLINLDTGETSTSILGETFPVRDFPVTQITEAALFVHDEIMLSDRKLVLIPGLRAEYYDLDPRPDSIYLEDNPQTSPVSISELSLAPKLGLVAHLGARYSIFAQYARGFRSPPFEDANIGLEIPLFNIRAIPNPDLQPETSDGFELGLRLTGRTLRGSASVYQNDYQDFIDSKVNLGPDPESGVLIFQSLNRESARIRGFEFELEGDADRLLSGLSFSVRYAHARGDDRSRDLPLNSIAPEKATLAVRYEHPSQRWGAEVLASFADNKSRVDESNTDLFKPPGYGVVDLLTYWRFSQKARLNLGLFNLADRQYWDWADVRGRPADDPLIQLYTRPGRNVSASLELEW